MGKRKLLLADDSVTIQKVVNLTFADEGIDVVTVGNGDAAIEQIEAEKPDMVLADVNMPGLNGYQVCEKIRERAETRSLPVLLLVGSFEPFDEDEASRVGANGYLTKPFQSIRQLVSKVSELIGPGSSDIDDYEHSGSGPEDIYEETSEFSYREDAETADNRDITDLYTESIAEPDASPGVEAFFDPGMDDEMIETCHPNRPETAAAEQAAERTSPFANSPFSERVTAVPEPSGALDSGYSFEERGTHLAPVEPLLKPSDSKYDLSTDDDSLLDLPDSEETPLRLVSSNDGAGASERSVAISPELLDLIVERVLERLEQNRRT